MLSAALPGLPGSADDPGTGPADVAALDGLLDDGGATAAPSSDVLAAHRAVIGGDHRELVASLVVPARSAAELAALLAPTDLGLRVLLAADDQGPFPDRLDALLAARSAMIDVDLAEVIGLRLPLPAVAGSGDPARLVDTLLDALDATVPTWITVPTGTPAAVLDALARDGAENVTLDLAGGDVAGLARLLRALVDRDLTFRTAGAAGVVTGRMPAAAESGSAVPGVLNVLCAVRAALNGAEPAELAQVLLAGSTTGLVSAVRRMSAADAAVTRAFLAAVEVRDAATTAAGLAGLGLLPDGAA